MWIRRRGAKPGGTLNEQHLKLRRGTRRVQLGAVQNRRVRLLTHVPLSLPHHHSCCFPKFGPCLHVSNAKPSKREPLHPQVSPPSSLHFSSLSSSNPAAPLFLSFGSSSAPTTTALHPTTTLSRHHRRRRRRRRLLLLQQVANCGLGHELESV